MKLLEKFKTIFDHKSRIKTLEEISEEAKKQRKAIDVFITQHDPEVKKYCSIRQCECQSCGLMFWEKDINHRYVTANEEHCERFYDLKFPECNRIIGNNDISLIKDWEDRMGLKNTFGEMCISTDEIVKQEMRPMRFFEFGSKGNYVLVLDIVKAPVFRSGAFSGTIGTALDVSHRESEIVDLLQYYMSTGQAKKLGDTISKRAAAYMIETKETRFKDLE